MVDLPIKDPVRKLLVYQRVSTKIADIRHELMKSTQWFLQEWASRCSLGLAASGYDQRLGVAGTDFPAKDDHGQVRIDASKNCIAQLCPIQRLQDFSIFFYIFFS